MKLEWELSDKTQKMNIDQWKEVASKAVPSKAESLLMQRFPEVSAI